MSKSKNFKYMIINSVALLSAPAALAASFNIPPGSLEAALDAYSAQTGVSVMVANEAIAGVRTKGVNGEFSTDAALAKLLNGTGFVETRAMSGTIGIVRKAKSSKLDTESPLQLAQAAPAKTIETVTVTSSKLGGADVQSIPIAITALSQEQLTATQTAGGPDLIKQVPNMTFTKTNFTGYNPNSRYRHSGDFGDD